MGQIWINEELYGSDESIDIHYNNSSSQIEAENVQGAIDYLIEHGSGGGGASEAVDVFYDDTETQTGNNNVQSVIEYLINKIKTLENALLLDGKTDNIDVTFEEDPLSKNTINLDNYTTTYSDYAEVSKVGNEINFKTRQGAYYAPSILWLEDLTNYNTIQVTFTDTSKAPNIDENKIGISNDNNITNKNDYLISSRYEITSSESIIEMDISGITGEKYIAVTVGGSGTQEVTIKKIELY